jgi:hypothetical protein
MDFLFRTTKADLINTLDCLQEDINLQKQQVNELIEDNDRKEKYITDDVNIVKNILEKLDYKELKALQTIFYEMEQHFYMCNRTTEEEQAFIRGLAEDINGLPTARFVFDDEEEEDDWTKFN